MSYEASAIVYLKFLIIPASRGCRREVVFFGQKHNFDIGEFLSQSG